MPTIQEIELNDRISRAVTALLRQERADCWMTSNEVCSPSADEQASFPAPVPYRSWTGRLRRRAAQALAAFSSRCIGRRIEGNSRRTLSVIRKRTWEETNEYRFRHPAKRGRGTRQQSGIRRRTGATGDGPTGATFQSPQRSRPARESDHLGGRHRGATEFVVLRTLRVSCWAHPMKNFRPKISSATDGTVASPLKSRARRRATGTTMKVRAAVTPSHLSAIKSASQTATLSSGPGGFLVHMRPAVVRSS